MNSSKRIRRFGSPAHRAIPAILILAGIFAFVFFATQTIPVRAQQPQPSVALSAPTRPSTQSTSANATPTPSAPARTQSNSSGSSGGGNATSSTSTSSSTASSAPQSTAGGGAKIGGYDYIDLVPLAKSLGYSAAWKKKSEQLTLTKGTQRIDVTAEVRDFYVNGMRVFAGSPIRAHRGSLWISRIDADNLFTPIADPSKGRGSVVPLKVIAIDAGHGGIDKGMINERLKIYEKEMALDTAQRLKTILEKQGYKVILTRTTDKKVELTERPQIADKASADLFISIHFNSVEASAQSVSGVEVYRFTPRYQPPVTRTDTNNEDKLANPADANGFWSSVAAYNIHRNLLSDLKATDRGFKHHKFVVLRLAKCPAVLIEAGFLSNDVEAKKVQTAAYRQKIAEAIADGVKDYAAAVNSARK